MAIQVLQGAKLNKKWEVREGKFGPFRKVIVSHSQLPKNEKGYNEIALFPSPDDAVCQLPEGSSLDLVYDSDTGKYKAQVPEGSQGQAQAAPQGNAPQPPQSNAPSEPKPKLKPEHFAKVYAKCYKSTEQALEAEGYPTLSEETLRQAAATVFIQYSKTNL